jgi:hypothetical protein
MKMVWINRNIIFLKEVCRMWTTELLKVRVKGDTWINNICIIRRNAHMFKERVVILWNKAGGNCNVSRAAPPTLVILHFS